MVALPPSVESHGQFRFLPGSVQSSPLAGYLGLTVRSRLQPTYTNASRGRQGGGVEVLARVCDLDRNWVVTT
jgi:hypothetical protein